MTFAVTRACGACGETNASDYSYCWSCRAILAPGQRPGDVAPLPLPGARPDAINSPHHYIAPNGMECIDVIESFGLGFRLGNVLKYLLRAEKKGGTESLKKAQWYLNREISKREETK